MTEAYEENIEELKIKSIIGFDGNIVRGFIVHPNGIHVVYPLGNKVSVLNWNTKEQEFLCGHTNIISAIDVSKSGKYVASGQINHIGFKACVILWDFESRSLLIKHELHKVRIEAVAFSRSDRYMLSLGGRDCGNIIVWDINAGEPLCGGAASKGVQGEATVVCTTNRRSPCFLTAGDGNLKVWRIDVNARNVRGVDVKVSKLRRMIVCMDLNERDEVCFCGTSTGDVMKIKLNFHHDAEILEPVKPPILLGCYSRITKKKLPPGTVELYIGGVRSIKVLNSGYLLIGAGDGTVDMVEEKKAVIKEPISLAFKIMSTPSLKVLRTTNVKGSVTSLQLLTDQTMLVGTTKCEIFSIDMDTFDATLLVTCHTSTIYDIAFPYEFSDVLATAGKNTVRVWRMSTMEELLRIRVHNFSCSSLAFSHDGKSILTGWNDGIIRAFTPLTGRLIYAIPNAHNKGVSALAVTHHGRILITGGCEGQVRLWEVTPTRQQLAGKLTEHKGPVSAIHINKTDDEAASASTDGTCIIWDIIRHCRKQILFANTLFMCVRYYPTGVQIMTAGSDRKLCYWEVLDGCLVREIEGSPSGAINSLEISSDGTLFVTGGNDEVIKLWKYQEGITTHIGLGHSAVITAVKFSPDGKYIVSASASGSVFIWENPFQIGEIENKLDLAATDKTQQETSGAGEGNEENIHDLPDNKSTTRSNSSKHSGENICCRCKRKCCACPKE